MDASLFTIGGAALIAITHTLTGPDHYLPFIFLSKARKWSVWKTTWITTICGIGHVGSTILLGLLAIWVSEKFNFIAEKRGDLAAWAFIVFGGAYMIWGLRRAYLNKPHKHLHFHNGGILHSHDHTHTDEHAHIHNKNITPWALFIIFALGPCEAMLIYFPASALNSSGLVLLDLIIVFSIVTVFAMVCIVLLSVAGLNLLPMGKLERYMHFTAGFIIMMSGIGIKFMGL